MSYWFFSFEGRFRQDAPEFAGKGVFAKCLVPLPKYPDAKLLFIEALTYHGIILVEIEESFEVSPEELDTDEPDNQQWLEWCEEARMEDTIIFDPWHLFDPEEKDGVECRSI